MKNNPFSPFALFARICFEAPDEGKPSAISGAGETVKPEGEAPKEGEAPAEGEAPKEEAPKEGEGKEEAPEPITMEALVLPEGFEIPEAQQAGVLELLNNQELSRADLVNKLIEMQSDSSVNNAEVLQKALTDQWTNTQNEWRTQLAAHPEIGGERLDESLAEVKTGLEAAGATKEVFDALDVTGAGNHPQLVALLHKLTGPYREANPVDTTPSQGKLSREDRMFPNMGKG